MLYGYWYKRNKSYIMLEMLCDMAAFLVWIFTAIPMNWQQVGDVVSTMSSTTSSSVVCSAATLVCQDPATSITMTDLMEGKVLDLRRWYENCVSHFKFCIMIS